MPLNADRNNINTEDLFDKIISELQSDREQRRETSLMLQQNTLRFAEIAKELPRIEKNLDSINEKLDRIDKENGIIRNELNALGGTVQYHSKLLHVYDGSNKPLMLRIEAAEKDNKDILNKFNSYIEAKEREAENLKIAKDKEQDIKDKKLDRQINIKFAILTLAITLILWLLDKVLK